MSTGTRGQRGQETLSDMRTPPLAVRERHRAISDFSFVPAVLYHALVSEPIDVCRHSCVTFCPNVTFCLILLS